MAFIFNNKCILEPDLKTDNRRAVRQAPDRPFQAMIAVL